MSKEPPAKRAQSRAATGDVSRQAITQFRRLIEKVVSEFEAEPCPEGQAEVRPALVSLLATTAHVAARDAERLLDTLPAAAVAALDRGVSDLCVIETTDGVLVEEGDGVKEKAIAVVKVLLPLIPKKFEWVKLLLEAVLALVELLQKGK